MDFEFVTDVTGEPLAKCDIESENFGDWLSHDVGTDVQAIHTLLESLDKLLNKQLMHFDFTGKIYHLTMADDEAELFLNNTDLSHHEFDDEEIDGPVAGCGLVELKMLLESWLEFIT